MRDSLDPLETFNRLLKGWWKVVILAALGGLVGLGVTYFLPPRYQAEAIIHASIDFTEINYENMVGEYGDPLVWTQFEEDLALQVVKRMVQARSNGTYEFTLTLDPDLSKETFLENYQIERYLSEWFLRYRHEDPKIAQEVVNYWAGRALQSIRIAQKNGNAKSFVIVDLVSLADEPTAPVYHQRSTLVLAGTAAGFFSGILLVDLRGRFLRRDREV